MEPFIGQIMMVPYTFAPQGWAFCNGQLLPISSNTALFSLVGTTYGGDGRTNFALPDLRGRVPMHAGNGPGLSNRPLGQSGGSENVTLSQAEMPAHTHNGNLNLNVSASSTLNASTGFGDGTDSPSGNTLTNAEPIYRDADASAALRNGSIETSVSDNGSSVTIGQTGGSQPHTNMQPFTTVHFVIALQGIYPTRG
jgi:microcystin-dependent protein